MRFSHFSPWIDRLGFGYSIFDQSQFNPSCAASPTFCGFEWHAKDSSVPVGGFPTRALFYQPRIGAAYDVSVLAGRSPWRLGPLLLSLRPVHERPRCIRRCPNANLSSQQLGGRHRLSNQSRAGSRLVCRISLLPEPGGDPRFASGSRSQGRPPAVYG